MQNVEKKSGAAIRLLGRPATRELVPAVEGQSARWHIHDFPGPYCRWNYHPEYEVHLVQRGTGRFVVGDCIDTFSAGQFTLIGSNLPHHWISDTRPGEHIADRDVVFQFHPAWIAGCQALIPELTVINPLLTRSSRGLQFDPDTSAEAAEYLLAIGATSGLERLSRIIGLFSILAAADPDRTRTLASPWAPRPSEAGSADVIDQVMTYIATSDDVSMATAAAMVGMSESTFSRYFSRTVGHSFSETVRKMRMARACQLLSNTALSVARVADRSGYKNLSNFNRQFHLVHGLTPTQFRRRAQSRWARGDSTADSASTLPAADPDDAASMD
ncbi:MAG TPA: AraC family transcriptional regulator [Microlunatus sp.]|nr:AraC family transcriptional regulator [Microlunatus sp.]